MTDRTDDLPSTDEARRLRLFDESLPVEASSETFADRLDGEADAIESDQAFERDLPSDLLALADRLASESRSLAMTYPARSPERLPIGETIAALLVEPIAPQRETEVEVRDPVTRPGRHYSSIAMAAALGFVAIIGAAIYSNTADDPSESVAEVRISPSGEPGVDASPSVEATTSGIGGVSVRRVSLSLENRRDYRRVESLLRDRSEPEREAMFDLLHERDGEATAVRISF